jgi:disease resistance protein RPM1
LVIIDGVEQRQVWDAIRAALPDSEEGSRVVVTTSMRSVATGCSAGSYLYPMCGLNKEQSADLFWAKLGPDRRQPALEEGLTSFFDRCDGLPLALVDTAHYLRNKGTYLNVDDCKDVSDALGSVLAREEHSFQGTRRTLARCCGRVREHDQKMCMLSVGSFPYGHQINRKRLIRRWMAEGLVSGDFQLGEERVASNCLGKLLDLGIVEPVPCGGGSTKVKRCQVHGVMLEFLVHRSMSWNFITLINKDRIVRNHHTPCAARRLSVYGSTNLINRSQAETIGLSRIRSLTICDTGTDSPMTSFRSCELLRVLDLEGCNWLLDGHLGDICGLLYLKYLSLRGTGISEIPSSIKDLHSLETLDVRDTDVAKLPMEVIKLPMITHLFGEFELPAELGETKRAHDLREFFSHESKLQTLSGFKIVSNNQGFQLILQHASKLRKVKIWCEIPTSSSSSTPPSRPKGLPSLGRSITGSFKRKKTKMVSNVDNLPGSLVSSLETRFKGSDALVSLSVDFGGLCQNFLHRVLQDPCAVSSIKVRGQMKTLPASPTLKKLRYIKEMHLCDTGMPCEELSRLQNLDCLVYLKLAEVREDCCWEGSFVVEADGFRSLEQLCFHGQKPLPYLEFQQGAKSPLISLQLICNMETANELLGVTGIIHLQHLGEVILHSDSPQQKVDAWKREALRHKNRPCIVKRQPGGQAVYNR